MTKAEQNKNDFDIFVEDYIECQDIDFEYSGLWTRTLFTSKYDHSSDIHIRELLERLTGSFNFEVKKLFIDNAFGFEVSLLRIIID